LQRIRAELNETPLKKTGVNRHLNFNYFELGDFVPAATKLFDKYGLCPIFSISFDQSGVEMATLRVVSGTEYITFTCPVERPTNMQGTQAVGAVITYYRRYLYMMCLDLVENDVVDASIDEETKNAKVEEKKATPKQVEMLKGLYDEENIARMLEYYGVNSIEEMSLKQASEAISRKKK
jgi:hypothetical protein